MVQLILAVTTHRALPPGQSRPFLLAWDRGIFQVDLCRDRRWGKSKHLLRQRLDTIARITWWTLPAILSNLSIIGGIEIIYQGLNLCLKVSVIIQGVSPLGRTRENLGAPHPQHLKNRKKGWGGGVLSQVKETWARGKNW